MHIWVLRVRAVYIGSRETVSTVRGKPWAPTPNQWTIYNWHLLANKKKINFCQCCLTGCFNHTSGPRSSWPTQHKLSGIFVNFLFCFALLWHFWFCLIDLLLVHFCLHTTPPHKQWHYTCEKRLGNEQHSNSKWYCHRPSRVWWDLKGAQHWCGRKAATRAI